MLILAIISTVCLFVLMLRIICIDEPLSRWEDTWGRAWHDAIKNLILIVVFVMVPIATIWLLYARFA